MKKTHATFKKKKNTVYAASEGLSICMLVLSINSDKMDAQAVENHCLLRRIHERRWFKCKISVYKVAV